VLATNDVGVADPDWVAINTTPGPLDDVSCPSTGVCVAWNSFGGGFWHSSNPFAATPVWNGPVANVGFRGDCPSPAFCVSIDTFSARTSTNPGAALPTWSAPVPLAVAGGEITEVACANDRLCLAVDDQGKVVLGVAAPQNEGLPTVSGTPETGSTLTAAGGSWTGVPSVGLQWERCTGDGCAAVAGATGSTLAVGAADVGATFRVVETATNAGGTTTATSAPTGAVPAPPVVEPPAPPAITPPAPPPAPNVRALLGTTLGVSGAGAKIGTLVRTGRFSTFFSAPTAGKLTVRWFSIPKRGKKAKLLAAAKVTFTSAGRKRVVIKLTRAGKRALRRAKKQLRVRIVAIWVPQGSPVVKVTRRVTLKR
jgi:hypothetical protein